jgi:peptidoglycan hydrolase FlgJ
MAIAPHSVTGLAIDAQSLSNLKFSAKTNSELSLPEVAKQFEGLFLNMVMKSMREALPQESPWASPSTQLYTGMLDNELVQRLADKGTGLADVLLKQLSRVQGTQGSQAERSSSGVQSSAATTEPRSAISGKSTQPTGPQNFVQDVWDDAQQAAKATGIPAKFMIGQAALESGWGKREIRGADGTPSFNVFGIKAGKSWQGATVDVKTTEYIDGVPHKVVRKFRAYESYAEAFTDYGNLITKNPRYAKVLAHSDDSARFAQGLQQAGYATDPRYADKLVKVINHSALKQMTA